MANQRKQLTSVAKHSHCTICGKVIVESETVCSDECNENYKNILKRQKYVQLAALIPAVSTVIFFIMLTLLR